MIDIQLKHTIPLHREGEFEAYLDETPSRVLKKKVTEVRKPLVRLDQDWITPECLDFKYPGKKKAEYDMIDPK